MILITGASGKTGQAVLNKLASLSLPVKVFVRHSQQAEMLRQLGASAVIVGNMTNAADLERATLGIATIYHICPNMHPAEVAIGEKLIAAAQANGVQRIVYHSVLHPQIAEMPHHWNKLQVEALLFKSGLDYTILQPAAYMQNVLAYRKAMVEEGLYRVPYARETRIGMVDLNDVAEVAARVICEAGHSGAIYELAGAEALSQLEVAATIAQVMNQPVQIEVLDRAKWAQNARQNGLHDYAINTLLRMFEYYEQYGFRGNGRVLEELLGRKAVRFGEWAEKNFSNRSADCESPLYVFKP